MNLREAAMPFAIGMTIFPHHDDGDDSEEIEITATRGDMRRLCEALGLDPYLGREGGE